MKFLILLLLFSPLSFAEEDIRILHWSTQYCSVSYDVVICLEPEDFMIEEFCPAMIEDRSINHLRKAWMSRTVELIFPASVCKPIYNSVGSLIVCKVTRLYAIKQFCTVPTDPHFN